MLVIDEWLISDLAVEDIDFLFELSELRYDSTSTFFCTLYRQEDWLTRLGGGAHTEVIIERYSHNVNSDRDQRRKYAGYLRKQKYNKIKRVL